MNTRAIYQRWKADIMRGASSQTPPPSPEALIQRLREAPSHVGYREAFALLSEAADALASSQEALRAAKHTIEEQRKDLVFHADCRPNRRQAEAAMADAKAVNDRMADEIKARREAEEALRAAERARDEAQAIIEAMLNAADSAPVSEFMASFAPVQEIIDLRRELESAAELACQQGRDALKAESALQAKEQEIVRLSSELENWKPREHTVRITQIDLKSPDAKPTLGTQGSPATFKASSGAETP